MHKLINLLRATALFAALLTNLHAAPAVGQPAPDFTLTDIAGKSHSLAAYKGKIVVLEWVNPECPFVKKHYGSGNIPALQKSATTDGIVWLSINSGHQGAQGDLDDAAVTAWKKAHHVAASAYLRDQDGKVGKRYDARTTPQMFVINTDGTLVYAGGIDDIRSADAADIAQATNYVTAALGDLKAGRPVAKATSQPYGCSVKY